MEKIKLTANDSSIAFAGGFLICQLAVVFATIIAGVIAKIVNFEEIELFLQTASGYLILSFAMYGAMLFSFFLFNKNKENKILSKPNPIKIIVYILISIVAFFVLYPIVNCADSLISKLGIKLNTISYNLTTANYFISIISLVLLPAICEELLFRGLIFKGLKPYGKTLSIMLTSVMFAIYHMSISQLVYPILFGCLLTAVMYKENNILYCILMHTVNNFIALTFSYLNINLVFNHWTYILLAIILTLFFIVALILFICKIKTEEKQKFTTSNKKYLIISSVGMIILWIILNIYS